MSAVPSSSSASFPPAKRPRISVSSTDSDDDDSVMDDEGNGLNQSAAEKKARKDARIIRNRESAQRSRNQRKSHLVWLEARVVELENENRRLKGDSLTPQSASPSFARPTTPGGFDPANDPGLSFDVRAGFNLATVAPPPRDLLVDVKPDLTDSDLATLRAENAVLRERVSFAEGLVGQMAAVFNSAGNPLNLGATLSTPVVGMNGTISPSLSVLPLSSDPDLSASNLACHPAVVATPPFPRTTGNGVALQRARTQLEAAGSGGEGGGGPGGAAGMDQEFDLFADYISASESQDVVRDWAQGPMDTTWEEGMRELLDTLGGGGGGIGTEVRDGVGSATERGGSSGATWEGRDPGLSDAGFGATMWTEGLTTTNTQYDFNFDFA